MDELLNGDANRYRHLDGRITELVEKIQNGMVNDGLAKDIKETTGDPAARAQLRTVIDRKVLHHLLSDRKGLRPDDQPYLVAAVTNEILGLGPLEPLWQDDGITEVVANGPNDIYVEKGGLLRRATGIRFRDQKHLLDVCRKIVYPINRKLDVKAPIVDGRLPDGSRVNVTHQAIAPKGPLLVIRRFPEVNRSFVDLVALGSMSQEMAQTLAWLVSLKATTLVVGGTGTGKTTLLNALSAAIPRHERVITIEDSLELRLAPSSHVAAVEARSGENPVTIRDLVKNALRQRPDRIVVGEVRDASALEMLQACNTGHEGSMSTVHANGPDEAIERLSVMVAQGGEFPSDRVDRLVSSALDLIVMIRRYKDGSRRVSGVYEVPTLKLDEDQRLSTVPLWEWERTGTGANGEVVGEYVKRNDISASLSKKLDLEYEPLLTWEEVVALSNV